MSEEETVRVLSGYDCSEVSINSFEDVEFLTEVQTNGTDTNGFQFQETLGVFRDQYDQLGLFKGSTDRAMYEKCSAVFMSNNGNQLSDVLLELAQKLKDMGE